MVSLGFDSLDICLLKKDTKVQQLLSAVVITGVITGGQEGLSYVPQIRLCVCDDMQAITVLFKVFTNRGFHSLIGFPKTNKKQPQPCVCVMERPHPWSSKFGKP